jgi:hypothetical protein
VPGLVVGAALRAQSIAAGTVAPPPIACQERPSGDRNSTARMRCSGAADAAGSRWKLVQVVGAAVDGTVTMTDMSCPFSERVGLRELA